MSFGSVLVTLRNSSRSDDGNAHVDGVLGLDVLTRYKAVINCRTKVIFFKVDPTRQMHLSGVAASENSQESLCGRKKTARHDLRETLVGAFLGLLG